MMQSKLTFFSLFQIALKDLQENSRLQPLLSSFANFLERLVGYSSENEHVIKRIPLIIYALINNPHLSIEPQVSIICFIK